MCAYKSSTSLGDGEEKGIRGSGGLQSSGGLKSSSDVEAQAASEGAAMKSRADAKHQRDAMQELATAFVEKFGFEVIVKPDSAGRVIYGNNKFTLELRIPAPAQGGGAAAAEEEPKTFFTTAADAGGVTKVYVTAGAINSVPVIAAVYTVADGDSVWIELTWNAGGTLVTAASVAVGASMPANTATLSYKLLATCAVAAGVTTVVPYGWNFTDAQACGSDGSGFIIVNYN